MTIRKVIRFLLVVCAPSIGFAQAALTTNPLTGDIHPIGLQRKAEETNIVFATLAAGAAADDNNNDSAFHPIGGAQYFVDPSVAIQETRSHLAWDLSYHPTLRFYVPSSSHIDLFNQAIGGAVHYDITKRLAIGLRQDYLRTDDPFQQLGDTPLQPGVGLINRPGPVLLSDFSRTQLLSTAEVNYRLAKYTTFGISGAFMDVQGHALHVQHTNLIDTHDSLGSAFLSHQFTARQQVGVQYQFLDIVFPGRDTRTRTNGVLLFDQIAIRSHLNFTIFAGPEYSNIHNQLLLNLLGKVVPIPVRSTLWSPAAGAMVDWRGDRVGLQASFVRRVSDGGGLVGAVEMNDGLLRLRVKLARRWIADLGGEIARHDLLNVPRVGTLEHFDLNAGIGYELARSFWVRAYYQRIQHISGYNSVLQFGDHDRLTVSVERQFNWPIGR